MDDDVDPVGGGSEVVRAGHVPLGELDTPAAELLRLARGRIPDERTHRPVLRAERMHDVGPDEAGSAGDEDHVKFL